MEGLAALMTKLLSSMGDMEARMEARLTLLESRFAAAFPSFTAPSPVPPQQHGEGIFYGGVDGTKAAAPIVLKASPRRRLGVHAPSTDLRLARLGARLARLGVQPPHLARHPPYRLENNGTNSNLQHCQCEDNKIFLLLIFTYFEEVILH